MAADPATHRWAIDRHGRRRLRLDQAPGRGEVRIAAVSLNTRDVEVTGRD